MSLEREAASYILVDKIAHDIKAECLYWPGAIMAGPSVTELLINNNAVVLDLEYSGFKADPEVFEFALLAPTADSKLLRLTWSAQILPLPRNPYTVTPHIDAVNQFLERLSAHGTLGFHQGSGLLQRVTEERPLMLSGACEFQWITRDVLELLSQHAALDLTHRLRVVGNSPHTDLQLIEATSPALYSMFGHQMIDISTLIRFFKYIDDATGAPKREKTRPTHRALEDCEDCVRTLISMLTRMRGSEWFTMQSEPTA